MMSPALALRRLRMVVAYDGAPFDGWQSQAGGNAVQDKLEAALAFLCGNHDKTAAPETKAGRIIVHGSGRTDAGVHARGQIAHADIPDAGRMTTAQWRSAINAHLPPGIRLRTVRFVADDFHSRFDATGKVYLYRIWNTPVPSPFEINRAWHLPGPVDLEILRTCAAGLVGRHDFAAFAANRGGKPNDNTVRTIRRVHVRRRGALLTLEFEGDGFLYKMVRLLTGTLIRCAQKRAPLDWIGRLLEGGKNVTKTNFAAPAEGLYLRRVLY